VILRGFFNQMLTAERHNSRAYISSILAYERASQISKQSERMRSVEGRGTCPCSQLYSMLYTNAGHSAWPSVENDADTDPTLHRCIWYIKRLWSWFLPSNLQSFRLTWTTSSQMFKAGKSKCAVCEKSVRLKVTSIEVQGKVSSHYIVMIRLLIAWCESTSPNFDIVCT
jgi:hypothetical protein